MFYRYGVPPLFILPGHRIVPPYFHPCWIQKYFNLGLCISFSHFRCWWIWYWLLSFSFKGVFLSLQAPLAAILFPRLQWEFESTIFQMHQFNWLISSHYTRIFPLSVFPRNIIVLSTRKSWSPWWIASGSLLCKQIVGYSSEHHGVQYLFGKKQLL